MSYTTGTWKADNYSLRVWDDEAGCWLIFAQIYGDTKEERDANIRLFKAAPDLLEACKAAHDLIVGDGWDGNLGHHRDNPVPTMLREAIKLAEGK